MVSITPLRMERSTMSIRSQPGPTRPGRSSLSSFTVVANRLPIRYDGQGGWALSPGGLVSALAPVLRNANGRWIGWAEGEEGVEPPEEFEGIRMQPVALTPEEVELYYRHAANEILWPLFHDSIRAPLYREDAWAMYRRVNRRFAAAAAETAPHGHAVWIHDYHLLLAPMLLRRLRPDLRIGLFIHIPIPPPELFSKLPWRAELFRAILDADVVGTQTPPGAENLVRILEQHAESEVTARGVRGPSGHEVVIRAFPISIESARYRDEAKRADEQGRTRRLRATIAPHHVLFTGVDRLDYTKGIDLRLEAFEHALERGWIDPARCRFVQVAVPSRNDIAEYQEIGEKVDALVGRINGRFSSLGEPVLQYDREGLGFEDLVTLYRATNVMVVTPVRDGMNLVAKEYVATRYDGTGELILSEFTGAVHELADATTVNPYDRPGLARAFRAAYERQCEHPEAATLMGLHETVMRNDVARWADSFLRALGSRSVPDESAVPMSRQ